MKTLKSHNWKKYPIILGGMWAGKIYYCESLLGCGKRVKGFKDKMSSQEYRVNGLCQECQDRIFSKVKE